MTEQKQQNDFQKRMQDMAKRRDEGMILSDQAVVTLAAVLQNALTAGLMGDEEAPTIQDMIGELRFAPKLNENMQYELHCLNTPLLTLPPEVEERVKKRFKAKLKEKKLSNKQ